MSTTQNESTLSASERKELDFLRLTSPYLGIEPDERRLVIVIPADQLLLRQNRGETWDEIKTIAVEAIDDLRRSGTNGGWNGNVQTLTRRPYIVTAI